MSSLGDEMYYTMEPEKVLVVMMMVVVIMMAVMMMVVLVMVMSARVAILDNVIMVRYKVGDLSWDPFNSSIAWRATSFSSMS